MFLGYNYRIMLKSLAIIVCMILWLPIYGQEKTQPAGNQSTKTESKPDYKTPPSAISVTVVNQQEPKSQENSANDKPKSYLNELLSPDNLINIALVIVGCATCLVIGWQSNETRKAANAAIVQAGISRQALIAQFRPRISVRAILLNETEDSLKIEVVLVNKGGTTAHIRSGSIMLGIKYDHLFGDAPQISSTVFAPFTLLAGEDVPLIADFTPNWISYRLSVVYAEDGRPQTMFLQCEGRIVYADDNGIERKTSFKRLYWHGDKRFVADSHPENEYED